MGNRIIVWIVFLLLVVSSTAQIPKQYIGTSNNRVIIRNQGGADSLFYVPSSKATSNLVKGAVAYNSALKTLEVYDSTEGRWVTLISSFTYNGLLSGGHVTWLTGLQFYVSPASYLIGGTLYNSAEETVTLDAADPSNPRIDVIALDSTGVIVITGTPAADPAKPQVDPATQIELTSVLVNAGATTPGNVNRLMIYDENVEWTNATNNITANFDNATNVFTGSKSIDVSSYTAAAGRYLQFTNGSTFSVANYQVLTIAVRLKATYAANATISLQWYRGSLAKSNSVTVSSGSYNFSRTVTAYQTVQVPLSAFTFSQGLDIGFAATDVNRLRITFNNAGGGLYLDFINIQQGAGIVTQTGVQSFNGRTGNVTPIQGDYAQFFLDTVYRRSDSVFGTKNGVERYLFRDSVGTGGGGGGSTDTTSLSNRINLKLNISDTAAMLSPYLRSNIYNSNGTLTGNRQLTLGGNSLSVLSGSNTALHLFSNGRAWFGNGTPIDAGYQLDVDGIGRFNNSLIVGTGTFSYTGKISTSQTANDQSALFFSQWNVSPFHNGIDFTMNNDGRLYIRAVNSGVASNIMSISRNSGGVVSFAAGATLQLPATTTLGTNATSTRLRLRNLDDFYVGYDASDETVKIATLNDASARVVSIGGSTSSGTVFTPILTVRPNRSNVGIGVTAPNTSSILELSSTTKGFLPPRMTGAQAEAIASPAEGLMIYSTDGSGSTITSKGWWGYDGTTWVKLN